MSMELPILSLVYLHRYLEWLTNYKDKDKHEKPNKNDIGFTMWSYGCTMFNL